MNSNVVELSFEEIENVNGGLDWGDVALIAVVSPGAAIVVGLFKLGYDGAHNTNH